DGRSGTSFVITRRRWLQLAGWTGVGVTSTLVIKAISDVATSDSEATPDTQNAESTTSPQTDTEEVPQPPNEESANNLSAFEFETVTVNDKGEEIERKQGKAEFFAEALGNGVQLEMVAIPAGQFMMGAPESEEGSQDDERPQHQVTVPSFFMGKTPITQAQWRQVASFPKVQRDLDPDPSHFKGDDRPVEKVSWYDALEFCARLSQQTGQNYRLPSEAEWEYACRAGTTTPFYFGATITTDLANYRGTDWTNDEGKTYPSFYGNGPRGEYREETTSVGTFPPNAFGLYDLHGNVWEWCADPWHDNYNDAPQDGRVWDKNDNRYQNLSDHLAEFLKDERNHILRGGSWYLIPVNCRSANRYDYVPGSLSDDVGFRVALLAARTL
ncbi:MAG: formylglycine-generating enzyme family protein, partial [Kamptonema sp. SIO4C4]|nr:formylglycine-generating enzyme family protein [Kamptonema sp. SIO4C4]